MEEWSFVVLHAQGWEGMAKKKSGGNLKAHVSFHHQLLSRCLSYHLQPV